jgi:hypothetical protein
VTLWKKGSTILIKRRMRRIKWNNVKTFGSTHTSHRLNRVQCNMNYRLHPNSKTMEIVIEEILFQ